MGKKIISSLSIVVILVFALVNAAVAQPGGSGDPLPCDPDDTSPACTTDVPLDTWVIFLVVIALGFGAWYLHKNQKRLFLQ